MFGDHITLFALPRECYELVPDVVTYESLIFDNGTMLDRLWGDVKHCPEPGEFPSTDSAEPGFV